jgi:hypothetical protein
LESIPGLHKRLKIRALDRKTLDRTYSQIQYLDEAVVEAEAQVVLLGLVQPQPADQPVRRIRSHLHLQLGSVPVKTYL